MAGNDMNMGVHDGLARRLAVVDAQKPRRSTGRSLLAHREQKYLITSRLPTRFLARHPWASPGTGWLTDFHQVDLPCQICGQPERPDLQRILALRQVARPQSDLVEQIRFELDGMRSGVSASWRIPNALVLEINGRSVSNEVKLFRAGDALDLEPERHLPRPIIVFIAPEHRCEPLRLLAAIKGGHVRRLWR